MNPPPPLTERLDGWLVRHRRRVLGVLLFAAVFLRLMVGMELAGGPLVRIQELVPASDNAFFVTWSRHLAEVDWLQREPLHPMPPWMRKVAHQVMREHPELPVQLGLAKDASYEPGPMAVRLWDHWLGGATYFQEPLYPYLMALTRVVAGPSAWFVFLWQGLLGVGALGLTYLVGRRLLGESVGVLAALLGMGYAPFMVHEFALLRDSLIVFATLALLWAFLEALDRGGWRWALFGALSGLSLLLKVPFVFFVALALVGALVLRRCKVRDVGLALGCMGLAMLPALLRNAAVGVPLFKLNGSGTAMLALFHVEDALPSQFIISKHYAAILAQADGHLLPSLLAAIRTHASLTGYLYLCVEKLVATVHGVEVPNNVDVDLFQNGSPALNALPVPFWLLGILGTVGVITTGSRWRQVWPLYVGILAGVPTLLLASVLTRYRLPMVAVLLPLAAAGLLGLLE
ncbi:glycosyltransferase family 39 protein, partial [Corallococcus llansteffanensis]